MEEVGEGTVIVEILDLRRSTMSVLQETIDRKSVVLQQKRVYSVNYIGLINNIIKLFFSEAHVRVGSWLATAKLDRSCLLVFAVCVCVCTREMQEMLRR